MTPQELLLKAADHIEKYGLARGSWVADEFLDDEVAHITTMECPACAAGAMTVELTGGADFSPNYLVNPSQRETLQEALVLLAQQAGLSFDPNKLRLGGALDAVIDWSDNSAQGEVVSAMRAAAG